MTSQTCSLCGGDHAPGAPCLTAADSRVGEELGGKYRIVKKLGEGGMGAVYEAHHTFVGRRFAIKFLHPEYARNAEMMGRFRREAQAAGTLESENIAGAVDFGFAADNAPYLVMELLQGEDLRGLMARLGPMSVPRAVNIVIQVCRGLDAAHARQIFHRDLKPENLFITRRGDGTDWVKILDFGIAKLKGATTSGASTRAGVMMGTLLYMPPEQVRGDKEADHRADIYSLGAVLYEMLCGQVPHSGETIHAILYKIMNEQPARLESLRANLPAGLAAAVHRALAFEPAERFPTVADFAIALTPFAGRQVTPFDSRRPPALAAHSGATVPANVSVADVAFASTRPPNRSETEMAIEAAGLRTSRRTLRRPAMVVGGAVLVLAGLLFALWHPWTATTASDEGLQPAAAAAPRAPPTGPMPVPVAPAPVPVPAAPMPVPVAAPAAPVAAPSPDLPRGIMAPAPGLPGRPPPPTGRPPPPSGRPDTVAAQRKAATSKKTVVPTVEQPAPPPAAPPEPTPRRARRPVVIERENPYE